MAAGSPTQTAIQAPKTQYLGAGALAAAQSPPDNTPTGSLRVSFVVDSVDMSLHVTTANVENLVFLLYVTGRWPWVNAFLEAMFRDIIPDNKNFVSRYGSDSRLAQRTKEVEMRLALIPAVVTADRNLKNSIATVLAEVAETALDIAFERASTTRDWLESERSRYGIDRSLSKFPCDKFLPPLTTDTPAGGVPDPQASSGDANSASGTTSDTDLSGGVPGTTSPGEETTLTDDELRVMAAAVNGLIEDLRQLFPLYCALQRAAEPHDALKRALDPPNPSLDTPAPSPDPKAVEREEQVRRERMTEPARSFAQTLRDKSRISPMVPGLLGVLVNLGSDNVSGKIGADEREIRQKIWLACCEYLTKASEALALVPRTYNSSLLIAQMANGRSRQDRQTLHDLGVVLDDTPEIRAALWTLRPDKSHELDPLEADTLLQAVKHEIATGAQGRNEAEQLQAAFATSIIESYRFAWQESQVILKARLHQAEAPLKRYDTTAAVLSLAGLALGSIAALPAAPIALYSLYYHAVNQYSAFNLEADRHQKQLLQDVLTDDLLGQIDSLTTTPSGFATVIEAVAPMVFDQIVMHLPGIGSWYAASMDITTILENN